MAFQTTINYDNAANLTYNATFAESSGGSTRLLPLAPVAPMVMYTSVRNGTNVDREVGTNAVTLLGATSIVDHTPTTLVQNKFYDLTNLINNEAAIISGDDMMALQSQFTIRIKYVPDYTTGPATDRYIMSLTESAGSLNGLCALLQTTTGDLRLRVYNATGSLVTFPTFGNFPMTQNQEYEIELNVDTLAGISTLFIDGVQIGSQGVGVFNRNVISNILIVGTYYNPTAFPSIGAYIRDVQVFNAVVHTAGSSFAGEVPRVIPIYFPGSQSVVPNVALTTDHVLATTGVEKVSDADQGVLHLANFKGADYWWDGLAWVVSDSSPLQANSLSDYSANISSFDISLGGMFLHKILLYSPQGLETPEITSVAIDYDFFQSQGTCDSCIIYGYVLDNCMPVDNAELAFKTSTPYFTNGNLISIDEIATTISTGYFELELSETATADVEVDVEINYDDLSGNAQSKTLKIKVPNQPSESLENTVV